MAHSVEDRVIERDAYDDSRSNLPPASSQGSMKDKRGPTTGLEKCRISFMVSISNT